MCGNLKNIYFKQFDLIIIGMQIKNYAEFELN